MSNVHVLTGCQGRARRHLTYNFPLLTRNQRGARDTPNRPPDDFLQVIFLKWIILTIAGFSIHLSHLLNMYSVRLTSGMCTSEKGDFTIFFSLANLKLAVEKDALQTLDPSLIKPLSPPNLWTKAPTNLISEKKKNSIPSQW